MNSSEPENNFLALPLNTLMDIKNAWHAHPMTCINVSSADMLQFAAFFATTRQKETPDSLIAGSATANAKHSTLRNDFFWGRPDETHCDIAWTDNLPGFITPATGQSIPDRCTGAGHEIKDKMMDRNGFTAGKMLAVFIIEYQIACHIYIRRRLLSLIFRGSNCTYWRPFNWDDS
jgi:hypothetical protein